MADSRTVGRVVLLASLVACAACKPATLAGGTAAQGQEVPAAPTDLTAIPGDQSISLQWAASEGALSYDVERGSTSGGPYVRIGTATSTSYADSGLVNGTRYYYVVRAANDAGEGAASAEASATPAGGAAVAERNIGINLFADQLDWVEDRLFADVMKTARDWVLPGTNGGGTSAAVDGDGWPTEDAELVVWAGIGQMNGIYHLEGDSASQPTLSTGFGGATVSNLAYSAGHFSADLTYAPTDGSGLLLAFTNTGGGVRNVKLMRPRAVGAEPYAAGTRFTDQAKALVARFNVIRFMWSIDGWNGPWQVDWADRVSPTSCSYARGSGQEYTYDRGGISYTFDIGWAGKGMAWEEAIAFANETGKDVWINVPIGASDGYVTHLAQLFKDTYTVAGGKIYWEISDEATWDGSHTCAHFLQAVGGAEAAAGGPVGYDGTTDANVVPARYLAKRAAEMSLVWRQVWGDAAMMTRVRPIVSGQLQYDTELGWGLDFVHNWYGNADGHHVDAPHPVSYFFYGAGGSHYTGDNPSLSTTTDGTNPVTASQIDTFESYEEEEACLTRMYGLKRTAYEGGVWTSAASYQLQRITDAMVAYQALWDKYDGDLLTYYVSSGGEDGGTALGFTQSVYDLDTRKFAALDLILAAVRPAPTAGPQAPCTVDAKDFSVSSAAWQHPGVLRDLTGAVTDPVQLQKEWSPYVGYLFRVVTEGRYSISVSYVGASSDTVVELMADGVTLGTFTAAGGTSAGDGTRSSPEFSVNLKPGLHALRVSNNGNNDYFALNRILICDSAGDCG